MVRTMFFPGTEESRNDLPQLIREGLSRKRSFTCAIFASAVNHFIGLGEARTVKQFLALDEIPKGNGFWMNERIAWLCRVLYEPRANKPLRPPGFGSLWFPHTEHCDEVFPLYPVAPSGSSYFVLSEGYSIGGVPELLPEYISYCQKNGVFRKKPIHISTREQAIRDVVNLRQSAAWKSLPWGGQEQDRVWRYIIQQAEAMPK